ncbi:hypothetical protein [Kitasatospora sp. NPDC008115]|uniref:hypothetical protein n=1 Tax=Kitasatospora sp. NPDC008115 TaxID=3364022 RepID=UPI0036E810F8
MRIAVVWLGRHRAVARAFRGGPTHGRISDPLGFAIVAVTALVLGIDHGIRRLILRLSDRPRRAVAAVGPDGEPVLVHHDRDERPVALAAAALADRVEREGPAALHPTGGRP